MRKGVKKGRGGEEEMLVVGCFLVVGRTVKLRSAQRHTIYL
jgi:hypothetical protein